MKKYIDANKLKEVLCKVRQDWVSDSMGLELETADCILNSIDDIIASLQQEQPEVDLVEEITPSLVDNMLCDFGVQSINDMDIENLAEFARHFYKLGLNARKEE